MKRMPIIGCIAQAAVWLVFVTGISVQAASTARAAEPPAKSVATGDDVRQLTVANKPWTGDFDKMLERRMIRVYAPYSRSLYYIDKGRERGIAAELVRDFERWVNQKYAKQLGKRPLTVYIVAATRDTLAADLNGGLADIAVGYLSATEEHLKVADFVAPDEKLSDVEILVTGPASPAIASIDDLSGKTVHVRKSSSYYESLTTLNDRLTKAGKQPANLVLVPDALEDEDMLEMTNAGLLQAMVVDGWKARVWAQVLPKVTVHETIVLRERTRKGWAIRKNSPQLAAVLNDFYASWVKKEGVYLYRQQQFMKNIKTLNNPATDADYKRFQQVIALFEKYGQQYKFDPLMLAAQGYQESTLDQNKKSAVGAIGVMQLMPATGAGAQGRRHQRYRVEHPRRRQVHGPIDDAVLQGCEVRRAEPHAVRVCELQRRAGQYLENAYRSTEARARPGQVVQQRRERHRREDRDRDHHVRKEHLQVLRFLQAHAGSQGDGGETQAAGRPGEELTGKRPLRDEELRLNSHRYSAC